MNKGDAIRSSIILPFQAIQAAKGVEASLSGFHVEPRDALVVQFESS